MKIHVGNAYVIGLISMRPFAKKGVVLILHFSLFVAIRTTSFTIAIWPIQLLSRRKKSSTCIRPLLSSLLSFFHSKYFRHTL